MKVEDTNKARSVPKPYIRVISFDLDNTLWNTSATIAAANNELAEFLKGQGIPQDTRVEHVMGTLFKQSKQKYCPFDHETAKSPVLLTQLRKDAIEHVLALNNVTDNRTLVNKAFDIWMEARHDAIAQNLVPALPELLQSLSEMENLTIGAITDGNSDPRILPVIGQYFDFCVNAEQVGVSKPDPRIYMQAVKQVITENPRFKDLKNIQSDEVLGPWWLHIGDDFTKDVVAAKSLGMSTVWSRELILDKIESTGGSPPTKEEKRVEDFVKEISGKKVIQMQVGAEDYLTDAFQSEFADAIVDRFGDLIHILMEWNSGEQKTDAITNEPTTPTETNASHSANRQVPSVQEKDTKFCMFCGEVLPRQAKFCVACGERQPELKI